MGDVKLKLSPGQPPPRRQCLSRVAQRPQYTPGLPYMRKLPPSGEVVKAFDLAPHLQVEARHTPAKLVRIPISIDLVADHCDAGLASSCIKAAPRAIHAIPWQA